MIRFSVFYPKSDDASFDHDYYRDKHVPMCADAWKPASVSVDKGIDGPYVAAVHFTFDSMEQFQGALGSEATPGIMADVANYTTITPVTQLNEVVS